MIADEPATDLTPRDPADAAALAEALEAEPLPGGSLRRAGARPGRGMAGLRRGPLVGAGRRRRHPRAAAGRASRARRVLDLCAAPGGKTLQLAAAGATVTAVDRSAARLRRLGDALARTGLAAEIVAADAETWDDARTFDAVLLDAPCTVDRHLPAQSRRALDARPARHRQAGRGRRRACWTPPRRA